MHKFTWNSSLETGFEIIDSQHRELFRRIDKLELALYKGRALEELNYILQYLNTYITEHFNTEEKLMITYEYPEYARHVEEHNNFKSMMSELIASCNEKGLDSYLAIDVDKLMRRWWENHVLKTDMNYVPYFKSRATDYL